MTVELLSFLFLIIAGEFLSRAVRNVAEFLDDDYKSLPIFWLRELLDDLSPFVHNFADFALAALFKRPPSEFENLRSYREVSALDL